MVYKVTADGALRGMEELMASLLRDGGADYRPFQSLAAIQTRRALSHNSHRRMEMHFATSVDKRLGEAWEEHGSERVLHHMFACLREMIENERRAWQLGYCVFYRSINIKYVLYAFSTLMLEEFASFPKVCTAGCLGERIACVSSLDEASFADSGFGSMQGAMRNFEANECFSDMAKTAQACLLSVNNSLLVQNNQSGFHQFRFNPEADPFDFFEGFDDTMEWKFKLADFMQAFFAMGSKEEAQRLLKALIEAYGSEGEGHLIQILVPDSSVRDFAFLCKDYGNPVDVYRQDSARSNGDPRYRAYLRFHHPRRPAAEERPVEMLEVLRSQYGARLQSRIIGHPNLYLRHGGEALVFHGNPDFNALRFRREMVRILLPHLERARALGRRLEYRLMAPARASF